MKTEMRQGAAPEREERLERQRRRKVPLYIPKTLQDVIWASTKDSTCVSFGFGHMCQRHRVLFDLKHVGECDQLVGVQDIARYARMVKEEGNLRQWREEDLLGAITQYTALALQLQRLTDERQVVLRRLHPDKGKKPP